MRKPRYDIGDEIGSLRVIGVSASRRSPSGVLKRYLVIKCLLCKKNKDMSTQTLTNAKSCGCEKYKNKTYSPLSGRKTKTGTSVEVNTLISIYKSNAKKRAIKYDLTYEQFEILISGSCFFCGDKNENTLRKKGYHDFKYTGIDRLNNNKGYTIKNSVSCCSWCNQAKNKHDTLYFINKCRKISGIEKDDKYFEIAQTRITQAGNK